MGSFLHELFNADKAGALRAALLTCGPIPKKPKKGAEPAPVDPNGAPVGHFVVYCPDAGQLKDFGAKVAELFVSKAFPAKRAGKAMVQGKVLSLARLDEAEAAARALAA